MQSRRRRRGWLDVCHRSRQTRDAESLCSNALTSRKENSSSPAAAVAISPISLPAENFLSSNSHFAKSALARFTPPDFIALIEKHGIPYHEKTLGQLFCDRSARDILSLLEAECRAAGVSIFLNTKIDQVKEATNSSPMSPSRVQGSGSRGRHRWSVDSEKSEQPHSATISPAKFGIASAILAPPWCRCY